MLTYKCGLKGSFLSGRKFEIEREKKEEEREQENDEFRKKGGKREEQPLGAWFLY